MKERFSGNKLWETRMRAGLSIEALAHRSGVKPKTIAKLEAGTNRRCNLCTEMMLAEGLGVPLRALYTERSSK